METGCKILGCILVAVPPTREKNDLLTALPPKYLLGTPKKWACSQASKIPVIHVLNL